MRILILYASIGSGHRISAMAIAHALRQLDATLQVVAEDLLVRLPTMSDVVPDVLSALALAVFPNVYNRLWDNEHLAELAHYVYELKPIRERVLNLLEKHQPDVVIATHAFPAAVAAEIKGNPDLSDDFLLVAVPTDYHLHPFWPVEHVDAYVAPTHTAQGTLIDRGFPAARIRPLGIPIRPQWGSEEEIANLRENMGLQDGDHLLTLIAGGGRPGPYVGIFPKVAQIANSIAREPLPHTHWHIVCGNNNPIESFLRTMAGDAPHITISSYVDNLPHHLQASSIVLSKPGGLIISECLAAGSPLALLSLGAGQEAANASFLLDMGVAFHEDSARRLLAEINDLLANPPRLQQMQRRARALGHPHAATELAHWVLEMATPSLPPDHIT